MSRKKSTIEYRNGAELVSSPESVINNQKTMGRPRKIAAEEEKEVNDVEVPVEAEKPAEVKIEANKSEFKVFNERMELVRTYSVEALAKEFVEKQKNLYNKVLIIK